MNTPQTITTEELDTLRELLIIWRSYTGEYVLIPTDENEALGHQELLLFFKSHFDSNIRIWKDFVSYVARSKLLMGKTTNFKASLKWIIKSDALEKIAQGYYHSYIERIRDRQSNKLS